MFAEVLSGGGMLGDLSVHPRGLSFKPPDAGHMRVGGDLLCHRYAQKHHLRLLGQTKSHCQRRYDAF